MDHIDVHPSIEHVSFESNHECMPFCHVDTTRGANHFKILYICIRLCCSVALQSNVSVWMIHQGWTHQWQAHVAVARLRSSCQAWHAAPYFCFSSPARLRRRNNLRSSLRSNDLVSFLWSASVTLGPGAHSSSSSFPVNDSVVNFCLYSSGGVTFRHLLHSWLCQASHSFSQSSSSGITTCGDYEVKGLATCFHAPCNFDTGSAASSACQCMALSFNRNSKE